MGMGAGRMGKDKWMHRRLKSLLQSTSRAAPRLRQSQDQELAIPKLPRPSEPVRLDASIKTGRGQRILDMSNMPHELIGDQADAS